MVCVVSEAKADRINTWDRTYSGPHVNSAEMDILNRAPALFYGAMFVCSAFFLAQWEMWHTCKMACTDA